MYIKNVTIDGFKSYARKAELVNLDKAFNAITGLNGSGKSNILDAICFVLGQSNMSQARVNNLRELIYKSGQAGVIKASVSITFDNQDKNASPPGYENYPDIIVTREVNLQSRSKYYINGYVATVQQVTDLFHAVQLNINNPHFLIMQGRITKVLNMKPPEILAMVEEATGASRYEIKKKHSQQQIEKKESDLRLIDEQLKENIEPSLEKLKAQLAGLRDFQQVSAKVEHLTRVLTAYKFVALQEMCSDTETKITEKKSAIIELEEEIVSSQETIRETSATIQNLEEQKDRECGGKLSQLEESLKEIQLQESKATANLNNMKDAFNDVTKKRKALQKQRDDDHKTLKKNEKEYDKLKSGFDQLEKECKEDADALNKAQKDFEAISTGASRSADGDASKSLADQLFSAKTEEAALETENKKASMKIQHIQKELDDQRKKLKNRRDSLGDDTKKCQLLETEVNKMQDKLHSLGFDESTYVELRQKRKQLAHDVDIIRREMENIEHNTRVRFDYRNPGGNFDPNNVYGMVCQLIKVKDPQNALALEVAAGGKLFNIIVKDQETAKALLERGHLQKSHTFLPLDRIQGRSLDPQKLRNAEQLVGKNNVKSALSLVDFDPSLKEAMKFVFGDTLICSDMDVAKKVAFAPNVKCRSVTLDGEDFSPSGTLSGGARTSRTEILQEMSRLKTKEEEKRVVEEELAHLENQLRSLDKLQKEFHECKRQYDLKAHELDLLKKSMENSNTFMAQQEVAEMEKELEALEVTRQEFPQKKKVLEAKIKDLQSKMKNSKSIHANELKEAEVALKKAQAKSDASRKTMSKKKQDVETLKLEIDDIQKGIESVEKQIEEMEDDVTQAEEKVKEAQANVNELTQEVSRVKESVTAQKKLLKSKSDEINKLIRKKEQLTKDIENKKLEIRKIQHQIEQIETTSAEASRNLKHLLKSNPWIEDEKRNFGNESAGYPFKRRDFDIKKVQDELAELQTKKNTLAKTVNMRANVSLVDSEKELDDVKRKRAKVEDDKNKLKLYMKEVDQKRKEVLEKAFVEINNHFGNIFSTLLPGTNAQLQAPPGKTIHEGMEVRVAFGDVWKETLTELSGGQRSLVALSLILALLRYNPAPIYILDEVDAALDQNHTTNIGQMIRRNFPDSQVCILFVVSLSADLIFSSYFHSSSSSPSRTTCLTTPTSFSRPDLSMVLLQSFEQKGHRASGSLLSLFLLRTVNMNGIIIT